MQQLIKSQKCNGSIDIDSFIEWFFLILVEDFNFGGIAGDDATSDQIYAEMKNGVNSYVCYNTGKSCQWKQAQKHDPAINGNMKTKNWKAFNFLNFHPIRLTDIIC